MRLLRRHETLLFLSLKVELGLYDLKFSLIFVKEIIFQRKKIFSSGVNKGGYWGYLPPPRILGVNTPPRILGVNTPPLESWG